MADVLHRFRLVPWWTHLVLLGCLCTLAVDAGNSGNANNPAIQEATTLQISPLAFESIQAEGKTERSPSSTQDEDDEDGGEDDEDDEDEEDDDEDDAVAGHPSTPSKVQSIQKDSVGDEDDDDDDDGEDDDNADAAESPAKDASRIKEPENVGQVVVEKDAQSTTKSPNVTGQNGRVTRGLSSDDSGVGDAIHEESAPAVVAVEVPDAMKQVTNDAGDSLVHLPFQDLATERTDIREAATSKSVKISVSMVTSKKRLLEREVEPEVPATPKTKLAEETLHAPTVESTQGPRVPRQDGVPRRRPSRTSSGLKDDRRVVRQGDGSLRSREALAAQAARNARRRKDSAFLDGQLAFHSTREDFNVVGLENELPPTSPGPKKSRKPTGSGQRRRKARKGSRKTTSTTTTTVSPSSSLTPTLPSAPSLPPLPQLPSVPSLLTEPPPPLTEQSVRQFADIASTTTTNPAEKKRDDKVAALEPEVRVTRQEDEAEAEAAEASMEALQTATDEVRVARQRGGRPGRSRPQLLQVPSVDFQQVDVNPDGSYRFAYNTNDEGQHFRIEQANSDNLVAGRYGYRDAEGKPSQTVYTAGPRGFRAQGTDIARKMDLSQAGGRGPRPPPDGRYSPEYDNYFDPLEDPSYSFAFRTPTYVRKEDADSRGDVSGEYSFIDDVGERHYVKYEAGAEKGFNVLTAFPDNVPAPGYHLGPGSPPRGRSSIVQNRDGSYRFVAAGPDSRREEVSDQVNNRRGSYSYIDDKGVQQTVEYVAGPGIGYRVINKHKGVVLPPTYATSFPPTSPTFTPTFTPPFTSPFPTPFPSPFPTTFPSSVFPPPFSSVAPSAFPGSGGTSSVRPSPKPGYPTTGRPNNQYIPPRPPSTSAPSIPPPFGDTDDPFAELFPGETGSPLRPGARPTARPTKKPKPSVSIDNGDGDFLSSPFPRPTVTSPSQGSGYPATSTSTSSSSTANGADNTIEDGLFGDGGDVSSTPSRPSKRPRPTVGTYRPPASPSPPGLGEDFLDLFPTSGPSSTSSARPPKRPRPRPRPRPTPSPRPPSPSPSTPGDDEFDTLFNPTPVYANPSGIPIGQGQAGGSTTSSGYDYSRPKKPQRRPGGTTDNVYPTTIRPGRPPTRPSVGGGAGRPGDDFLTELDAGGRWSSGSGGPRPGAGPDVAYGNCCPGRPGRLRYRDDFIPGSPFPPGAVVRAHVQSVDLMPYEPHRAEDPGEALERFIRQEQSLHAHRQRSVDSSAGGATPSSTTSRPSSASAVRPRRDEPSAASGESSEGLYSR